MSAPSHRTITRRRFLKLAGGVTAAAAVYPTALWPADKEIILRTIPSSGIKVPVIGMGSWGTFDIDVRTRAVDQRVEVLRTFFSRGGALIDSSPMYGLSEETIGYCLGHLDNDAKLFSATKVWKRGQEDGIKQMENSLGLWGEDKFSLMQIHNMVDWEAHLETLKEWKSEGRIGHIGITTSHGRRHDKLEQALKTGDFDFVQLTYTIADLEAEKRLLPLAADLGLAVITNRPFRRAGLFSPVQGKTLPSWAAEFDCQNWAQFFLKFIVSHPTVTCAIPATHQVPHMVENMGAAYGRLPDEKMRRRMVATFEAL